MVDLDPSLPAEQSEDVASVNSSKANIQVHVKKSNALVRRHLVLSLADFGGGPGNHLKGVPLATSSVVRDYP